MVLITPYAVQGTVMGLFPLLDTLPARATQTRAGLSLHSSYPLCRKDLIQSELSSQMLLKDSPGALQGLQVPAGQAHLVLVRMSQ